MKLLDRIALNRLINIIVNFILEVIKIFAPKKDGEVVIDVPEKRKPILPWRRKKDENSN